MQNAIEDSVHALLSAEIRDKLWSDFVITDNAIRLRGEDVLNTVAWRAMLPGAVRPWIQVLMGRGGAINLL